MILVFPIRCLCIWIACTTWSHDDITGDFYCSYARLFQYEVASVFSCAIVEKEGFLLVLLPDHFLARCLLTDVITVVNILCSSVARNAKIFVELIDIDRDLHFDFRKSFFGIGDQCIVNQEMIWSQRIQIEQRDEKSEIQIGFYLR